VTVRVEEATMREPDAAMGANVFGAADAEQRTDEQPDDDRETVGAADAEADAVRSGADADTTTANSGADLAEGGWDEVAADRNDQERVGLDDARADAERTGADPDQV